MILGTMTRRWVKIWLAPTLCLTLVSAQPALPPMTLPSDMTPTPKIQQVAAREVNADVLGDLLADARKTYPKVKDYSCVLVKQERVNGKLLPEQTAQMTVRTQPFSVSMKFMSPSSIAGQEVCYVAGKNDGKMRVKGSGLKGALGFITIGLDDSRAMAQNRHTIETAGIGALIEQITKLHAESRENKSHTTAAEYLFNGRTCSRIEITQPEGAKSYCHRSVLFFEKETGLPVRFEAYDRPTQGNPAGELLECYSYANLKFNGGVTEAMFAK